MLNNAEDVLKLLREEEEAAAAAVDAERAAEKTEKVKEPPVEEEKDEPLEAVAEEEDDEVEEPAEEEPKKRNAFAKMRHEAKQLQEQLDKERTERQAMAERLARIEGRHEAQPKAEAKVEVDEEPDRLMYPEDHNAWQIRQMRKENEEHKRMLQETKQQVDYSNALRGVELLDRQYKTANPKANLDGAVSFLMDKEKAIKKVMNPSLTEAQISSQIEVDRVRLYSQLVNDGRNPAEVIYQLAKQHGFTEETAKEAPKKTDLAAVERNQRKAATLIGGSPATKDNGKASSEDVLTMGFQQLLNKSRNRTFFSSLHED